MGHLVARYVRSLAPLTPLTRYAALRSATLTSLASSIHGLAHTRRSLPRGTVKFINMCSCCKLVSQEQTRVWSSLETRPYTRSKLPEMKNH